MRRSVELQIITEALQKMGPHAPATRVWGRAPGATGEEGASGNVWAGDVHDVALHIVTRLYGSSRAEEPQAPLVQAEEAKRRRDIVGETGALMAAGEALESAPWYPCRPGDLVHVHYPPVGDSRAYGETYIVGDAGGGLLAMQLFPHTVPDSAAELVPGLTGFFAVEATDCPVRAPWYEAGPDLLTIVRDGRAVHAGGAR